MLSISCYNKLLFVKNKKNATIINFDNFKCIKKGIGTIISKLIINCVLRLTLISFTMYFIV